MECKKELNKLGLKGYLVTEGSLIPINHSELINISDMNKQTIVVKLEDVLNIDNNEKT